ncbi:MAG: hypothetical protein JSS81_19115 [Acidobacteria bacterium]|nr:hypothetical protein [Acidobacteriota bacterium]
MKIHFDGVIGILIFLAVAAGLLIVFAVSALVSFFAAPPAPHSTRFPWAWCYSYSSAILLVFDGFVFLVWMAQTDKTITVAQGQAFDRWMFYYWLPLHFVVFFAVAYAFRGRQKRKAEIDRLVDKLR